MSVDQRIRQAFADLEVPTVPEVNAAMDRVLVAERRGRVRRRTAVASGVAAAVATGAVLWGVQPADGPDSPAPAPPAPASSATSARPLVGEWTTRPLTRSTIRAHLNALGLAQDADRVVAVLPEARFRFRLHVRATRLWALCATSLAGKLGECYDVETVVRTDKERLFLEPYDVDFEGGTTYEMTRTDTTLRLRFIGTEEPVTEGVPGAVWQQAFYTVAPFHRE